MAQYRSVYIKAKVQNSMIGGPHDWEWYRVKPNRYLAKLNGATPMRTGFDGTYAFSTCGNPDGVLLEGTAAMAVRTQADFFFPFVDLARFKVVDSVQTTTLNGKPAYQARVIRLDNSVDTLYFDPTTGYKIAETTHDYFWSEMYYRVECYDKKILQGRSVHYRVFYFDYQSYGRIRLPRITQEQINPGRFETTTIQRVEFDTVDNSMFLLPLGLEMRLHP